MRCGVLPTGTPPGRYRDLDNLRDDPRKATRSRIDAAQRATLDPSHGVP